MATLRSPDKSWTFSGWYYPLVVHVAQWLIGELVSDQHKLVWKKMKSKKCVGIALNYKLGKQQKQQKNRETRKHRENNREQNNQPINAPTA